MKLRRRGRADFSVTIASPFEEVTVLRGSHGWVRLASATRACVANYPGLATSSSPSRATTVPFTVVLNGPERTTTDNTTTPTACAVSCRRR
jgi:hypothetical protein